VEKFTAKNFKIYLILKLCDIFLGFFGIYIEKAEKWKSLKRYLI